MQGTITAASSICLGLIEVLLAMCQGSSVLPGDERSFTDQLPSSTNPWTSRLLSRTVLPAQGSVLHTIDVYQNKLAMSSRQA